MPVVPMEQNRVGIASVNGEKLRAPDRSGGIGDALAQGGQRIGAALANYAITQDEIQDHADKLAARNLALQYKNSATKMVADFKTLQGVNAVNGSAEAQMGVDQARKEVLDLAANPRQRAYLQPMIEELHPDYMNGVYEHSKKEQFTYSNDTYAAEAKTFGNEAAGNFGDPAKQAKSFEGMNAAVDRLGHLNGWSPEQVTEKKLELRGAVHVQAVDLMLSHPDADVGGAAAYYAAHKGEMTVAQQAAVEKDLQKPLEWRQAQDDIAGIAPVQTKDGGIGVTVTNPGSGYTRVATDVAQEFGLDPVKVAAIISYETGGTFNPKIMGGKGGNYMGLIQLGPEERKKYGITADSSPEQWSEAVRSFLKDRGFKKGMSTLDLYSTINAGSPGRYNASDGNGTVTTHHDKILAQHTAKGEAWLKSGGAAYSAETPQEWNKDAAYDALDARAKAGNWSPERTERAKQAMDVKVQRDEQMLGRQREQADEAAFKVQLDLGANFTSMSQIPRSVRDRMSPQTLGRFQEQADRNLTAKTTIPDDTADSLYLQRLSRETPQDFAKVDLGGYMGKISDKDMKALWLKQGDVRGNPPKDDDIRGGITKAMTFGQKYGGVELKDKEWPGVYDTMEGYLLLRKSKKGTLDPADYDDAFKFAVRTRDTGNRNYEVFRDQIPPEFEAEVRKNWRGPNKPTRGQIIEAWIKMKGGA